MEDFENDSDEEISRKYIDWSPAPSELELRGQFERLLSECSTISDDEQNSAVLPESNSGIDENNPVARNPSKNTTSETDLEEVVLSLLWQNGHLGAAIYSIATSELYVMEDTQDSDINDFGITKTLYKQYQPSRVVSSAAMTEKFLTVVKKLIVKEAEESDVTTPSSSSRVLAPKLKLMSRKDNDIEVCTGRVNNLKLDDEPENASAQERKNFLNSVLNFKCRLMIHALGLLLKYLDKNWSSMVLDSMGQPRFVQLHHITLQDIVMVDDETYNALQIVRRKYHPSFFKFGMATSNQGLSLFSILNRCQSRPGAKYLWNVMLNPSRDVNKINARLDVIQFCIDPKNNDLVKNLKQCLKYVNHVTTMLLHRLKAPQAKGYEWRRLYRTVCNVIHIADICSSCKDAAPLFTRIVEGVTDELHNLRYFLEYVVDFDSCKQQNKFVVKAGVDPEFDHLNHLRQTLPQILTLACHRDLENLPPAVNGGAMLYLPNIGYVLAITQWEGSPLEDAELPSLEFKFLADGHRHYKSPTAIELDDTIGDVLEKITNRQSELMIRLVQYISKHIQPIIQVIRYCAELDTLISLSMVAQDNNYVRPVMQESHILDIKQGRHPLQELCTTFVPNDTCSGPEQSLIKILTGPNASGKSIYLKQIGLIVFMAHIGCYVPAESATIGIVTHILTRIHFADTTVMHASTFTNDIRQMTKALYSSTPNSLILIDEFGKGSSHIDGFSLLGACLNHFIQRGIDCPHTFVSTHFHKIFSSIPQTPMVEQQTFKFMINEDRSLVYLYQIISGRSNCSFAHSVATSCGIDSKVVDRAREVFECIKRNQLPAPLKDSHIVRRAERAKEIAEYLMTAKDDLDLDDLKRRIEEAAPTLISSSDQTTEPASTS